MERKKSNTLSRRPESIIFMLLIGLVSVLLNFTFSHNSFAEYKATLSASVNEDTAAINGTEVIESSSETTEHAINLKVKTTNKTGYTATISSKTEETALLNTNPAVNTKINSISSTYSLANFPANTWGYRFDDDVDFSPIPAQSASVNLIKTTEKSTAEENHTIKLGMKLNSSLKPGNYENKLIISVVSNPYTPKAIMTDGPEFNEKLRSLETSTNKIEHFKKSTVAPANSTNAVNIEDEESDCEIKLWLDPTDKTAYYYAESEKVYLYTYAHRMFSSMSNLTTLDLSHFDTSNVASMSGMFSGMTNLTTLDLSHFDTSNVASMSGMFSGMTNLTTLDLSHFDTSKVTNMGSMFYGLFNLTTLNVSHFDTSKVKDMGSMFADTYNLTTLNLSNFDTSQVTNMNFMFYLDGMYISEDKLETIYVNNDFNTAKLTDFSGMFQNRKKLRGGNGSYLADPSTADKTWLRVDRPGVQGYFTRRP